MRIWNVILAALVLYATGVITGWMAVTHFQRSNPRVSEYHPSNTVINPALNPISVAAKPVPSSASTNLSAASVMKTNFVKAIEGPLDLTQEQHARILHIITEGQKKSKELSDSINPSVRENVKNTRDQIRAVLNTGQQTRFDELTRGKTRPKPPEKPKVPKKNMAPKGSAPATTQNSPARASDAAESALP